MSTFRPHVFERFSDARLVVRILRGSRGILWSIGRWFVVCEMSSAHPLNEKNLTLVRFLCADGNYRSPTPGDEIALGVNPNFPRWRFAVIALEGGVEWRACDAYGTKCSAGGYGQLMAEVSRAEAEREGVT
jgi:hypothetical protein